MMQAHRNRKPGRRAAPRRRLLPVAAAVGVLLALTVTAAATGLFGIADLLFPREAGGSLMALQGYSGSAEYQATSEWLQFQAGYDPDGAKMAQAGCTLPEGVPLSAYMLYNTYTRELYDALERIAVKYDLALHTAVDYDLTLEELTQRSADGDFIAHPEEILYNYAYEDGSFHLDCSQPLEGDAELSYQVMYTRKGTLDERRLSLEALEEYRQWELVTQENRTVHLAIHGERGILVAELEHGFFCINVHLGGQEDAPGELTQAQMERLLAGFDLSMLK